MYTVLKNQTFQLMLSLDNRSYPFFCSNSELFFQNPYFFDTCATVYDNDRFDFPLMADKIRVRSADKGFVVQSSDEAMKRCLYGDLCSLGFH